MAVAYDASSESHTGTAGSTAAGTFSWTHTPTGSPKGVLAYTFVNANADAISRVSYGGWSFVPVSGGRAVDTAGEPGDCKAWFLSGVNRHPTTAWADLGLVGFSSGKSISAVAYGNGYWVAENEDGVVRYATDPTGMWSAATSAGFISPSQIAYANNIWVRVGLTGKIITATDPTGTWSEAASAGFGTTPVRGVAYGNGYWVAVGNNGVVRYATDPTGTWSAATSPGFGTTNVYAVAYGPGVGGSNGWVAVGAGGSVRTASDPTGTWSAASSPGFSTSTVTGVAYGDGYWVAVTSSNTSRYTTDATGTWSAGGSPGPSSGYPGRIAYGSGVFVAVGFQTGASASIRCSADHGVTWTAPTATVAPLGSTGVFVDVAHGDGNWLVVGGVANSTGTVRFASNKPVALPTGAKTVSVTTTTADEAYAVAISVTADYEVEVTGVSAVSADASGGTVALAGVSVDDGSPGTNSLRFAGVNSGLSDVPTANSGTTNTQSIDFGTRVIAVAREDTAGQGSRSIGWTAAADDVAAVYLAIREAIVPWTVGVPIR